MSQPASENSRGLIKSMLVMGSAQAVNIFISIVRMKVIALLLGPNGIGLLSIYINIQSLASTAAGLGMDQSGVRQVASNRDDLGAFSRIRRGLLVALLVQGTVAMLVVWLYRVPIAVWLLGDGSYATEVGLIGVASFLGLLATAQTVLLQGMRQINDLGRVTVLGAFVGTVVGLAAIWHLGQLGLVWFIIAQPFATFLIALRYVRRLPQVPLPPPSFLEVWGVWKPMARLGAAFMFSGLATTATLLAVRTLITQDLGLQAAGQFAASWGIAITYVGFLLGAMSADYFPRLTEVIHDREAAVRLINDQLQLGLAIGGPVLLLLIGTAPWLITLFYSDEFIPAATLLQWQTVGNVFKIASWALAFSIAAAGRSKTFLFMELSFNFVFIALVWLLLPVFGLTVAAISFVVSYIVYLCIASILARSLQAFRWQNLSLWLLATHTALSVMLLILAQSAPSIAAVASPILALATGIFGLRIVLFKIGDGGKVAQSLKRIFTAIGWPIGRID